MPLARTRTNVGKSKPKAKYMKKTTTRGAYNKNRKKQMMIRNAPFKETKSKTSEDLRVDFPSLPDHLLLDTAHTEHRFLNPEVFTIFKQGLDEHPQLEL